MESSNNIAIVKKVILFLVLIITINGLLSWFYFSKITPRTKYYQTEQKFESQKASTQTLFLGHSRCANGIDADQINGAFNFASFGESNIYTYYKFREIIEDSNLNITRVIIPYGFSSFVSFTSPAVVDQSYWNRYIDYAELGQMHNQSADYFSSYLQSVIIPYARSTKLLINKRSTLFSPQKMTLSEFTTYQSKYTYAKATIAYNSTLRNYYDEISLEYLQRFLALCAIKKIEVIAIKYPVTKYYREVYKKEMVGSNLSEQPFISALQASQATLWNEESIFDSEEQNYKDTHHLNELGKEAFTLYIANKLEAHIKRQSHSEKHN